MSERVLTKTPRYDNIIMYNDSLAGTIMTLDQLKTGQSAVITAVGGSGALRCRLLDMGLIPKTKVTLQKTAPLGDPIEILVRGYELTIRLDDARQITVDVPEKSLTVGKRSEVAQ